MGILLNNLFYLLSYILEISVFQYPFLISHLVLFFFCGKSQCSTIATLYLVSCTIEGTCSVTLLSFVTSLFKSMRALLLHSKPYCKINKNNSNNLLKFRFNKSADIFNFFLEIFSYLKERKGLFFGIFESVFV